MLFLFVLFTSISISAQVTISGTVSEADGSSLPGVGISVKGTALGTAADMNGNFTLIIPTDRAVLVFKYLGFENQEVSVFGNTSGLKVVMKENAQVLDEVVVIGYGGMKRSDLTGSVASIRSEDIRKSMSTSLEQAMQGRLAGVQVTQNSGAPGAGISVSIRGVNTLNGNEPLYVIDGVAISSQPGGRASSVLSSINPDDIESLEVLKDASATAIYGSRASNGVVMITTKKGAMGKPILSYDGYYGLQQLPTRVETMNLREYAEYYNQRAAIQGWGIRDDFRDPSLLNEGTDWQSELFRTAPMHNHTIGVRGGSNGVMYSVSGGLLNQEGIGIGSDFKRFTFRSNIDMEVAKWLSVGVNGSVANTKRTTTMDEGGIISAAINQRPDVPARNLDGSYGAIEEDQFNTYYINPLAAAQMRENYDTGTQLYYTFYADLKPLPGLTFRTEYGGNLRYGNNYSFTPNYRYGNQMWTSRARKESNKGDEWFLKNFLTYDWKAAQNQTLQIMGGHEAQSGRGESLWGERTNYISNAIHSLNVGGEFPGISNGDGMSKWAIESYFGRLNYNFDNRYILTASLRVDGSSTFGPNNRWGTFPSVAFAWRINNESFLKDVQAINNMKLRLGWGMVGNSGAGSYAYGATMSTTATAWGVGFFPANFANPDLKWESTKAYNIGLDLNLFKNRLELITEVYSKNIDNLLLEATLPSYAVYLETWVGIRPPWVNTGAMENKGLEFTLNTVNIDNKKFFWNSNITLSFNRNKLLKMYSDSDALFGEVGSGNIYTKTAIGEPIGQIFGYNVIGMFSCEDDFYQKDANGNFIMDANGNRVEVARPADNNGNRFPIAENQIWVGDYIFEDVNGDGIIDEKDRKYLGNTAPKFFYGFNNSFSWKNFELNVFLNGVYGNKVYNMLRQQRSGTDGYSGKLRSVAGFARVELIDPNGENDISNVHVTNAATATASRIYAVAGNRNDNERISSRFVEDGSFLRLKNVSMSYTIPKQWLKKYVPVDFLQVYASVQNLYTFSKYKGYDPEIGSYDVRLVGIDNARYPPQRIYKFGLRLNF